jgi:hypothetical protein
MLLKGSRPQVLSRFTVSRGQHCTSLFCRIHQGSLKKDSTSAAIAYACRGYYSYFVNVEHTYRVMPSQSPHPVTSPDVRNVQSLSNRQNRQKGRPSGNSQLPPDKRHVTVLAGKRDSSQGGSSVSSTIQGPNCTPSCWLNNYRVADITQCVTSTPSATP